MAARYTAVHGRRYSGGLWNRRRAAVLILAGAAAAQPAPAAAPVAAVSSPAAVHAAPVKPSVLLSQIFAAPTVAPTAPAEIGIPEPTSKSCTVTQCRQPCRQECTADNCTAVCINTATCLCGCSCP